jgi:ankyrin repeat protein
MFRKYHDDRQKSLRQQGFQGHHLVPKELGDNKRDFSHKPFFQNAQKFIQETGFDIRSQGNCMFLPDGKKNTDGHDNRSLHRGGHAQYTKDVAQQLSKEYKKCKGKSLEEKVEAFNKVVRELRNGLRTGVLQLNGAEDYSKNAQAKQFNDTLSSTGLGKSYQNSNPKHELPGTLQGGKNGPGGVMIHHGLPIQGLKDGIDHVLEDAYHFALPNDGQDMPFSNDELQQIIRELAHGIYCHDAVPFFSLHFNQNHTQYPVIHPAYQRTLVGRVISILDYMMKGYLNGAIFTEKKIDEWDQNPTLNNDTLNSQLVNLYGYIDAHRDTLGEISYYSLQDLMGLSKIEQAIQDPNGKSPMDNDLLFQITFRIIGRQDAMQKTGNVIIMGNDFDVEYDIEPTPDYDYKLAESRQHIGKDPEELSELHRLCKQAAKDIKTNMPKLPFCKSYFNMLHVINAISHFFITQKDMGNVPCLLPVKKARSTGSPNLFPPIPIQKPMLKDVNISLKKLYESGTHSEKKDLISNIQSYIKKGRAELSPSFKTQITNQCLKIIKSQWENTSSVLEKIKQTHLLKELGTQRIPALVTELMSNLVREIYPAIKVGGEFDQIIQKLENNRDEALHALDKNRLTELNQLNKQIENERSKLASYRYSQTVDYNQTCRNFESKILEIRRQFDTEISNKRQKINAEINRLINEINSKKNAFQGNIFQSEQLHDLLEEICLKFKLPLNKYQVASSEDNKKIYDENPHRISGGCGISVESKKPTGSFQSAMLNESIKIQKAMPLESMQLLSVADTTYSVFKLSFEPYMASDNNDYFSLVNLFKQTPLIPTKQAITMDTLIDALTQSNAENVQQILSSEHINLNQRDALDKTPLYYAIQTGNKSLVEILVKANAKWNAPDKEGMTDYQWAIIHGDLSIIEYLDCQSNANHQSVHWDHKNNQGHTAVSFAVQYNHKQILQYLLKKGASVNHMHTNGLTPLFVAIMRGHTNCAQQLIQHKPTDLTFKMSDKSTALHFACHLNHPLIIDALIEQAQLNRSIDETAIRRDHYTALHILASNGDDTTIKKHKSFLLKCIKIKTMTEFLPIHLAAINGHIGILDILIKEAPELLNKKDMYGDTPLMGAIKRGQWVVALWLRQKGSSSRTVNKKGETPMLLAASLGQWDICDALISNKTTMITNDPHQWNLMHYLARSGHWHRYDEWIRRYPELKSQLLEKNNQGDTPYDVALQYGHFAMAHRLKNSHTPPGTDLRTATLAAQFGDLTRLFDYIKSSKPDAKIRFQLLSEAARFGQINVMDAIINQAWLSKPTLNMNELWYQKTHVMASAILNGQTAVIDWLLYTYGVPLKDPITPDGRTPIALAVQIGNLPLIQYLQKNGATCDAPDSRIWAFAKNHPEVMDHLLTSTTKSVLLKTAKYIIEKGHSDTLASWLSKNMLASNIDLLKTAIECQQIECLQLLVQYGTPLDTRFEEGKTVLMKAIETNNIVFVEQLLGHNVPLIRCDNTGRSLLDYAKATGQNEMIRLISIISGKNNPPLLNKTNHQAYLDWLKAQQQQQDIMACFSKNESQQELMAGYFENTTKLSPIVDPDQCILGIFEGKRKAYLPWQWACLYNQPNALKATLPRTLTDTPDGIPPIWFLAHIHHPNILEKIIKKKNVDIYATNVNGDTAMHIACQNQVNPALNYFLGLGIKVNQSNHNGITPLIMAIGNQHYDTIELLLEAIRVNNWGMDDPMAFNCTSPLLMAIQQKNGRLLDTLLRMGYSPNITSGGYGITALMLAVESNQHDTVLKLLAAGADITQTDYNQNTVAHYAAKKGNHTMIPLLAQYHETPNDKGLEPIHISAASGHWTYLLEGLNNGIFSSDKTTHIMDYEDPFNTSQKNAFHLAAAKGAYMAVKVLLNKNKHLIRSTDSNNQSAIVYGAQSGSIEIMKQLTNNQTIDKDQAQKAIINAAVHNHTNIIQFIESLNGPIYDIPDNQQNQLLHKSAYYGANKSINYLLNKNANPNEENVNHLLPIHIAIQSGSIASIQVFLENNPSALSYKDHDGNTLIHHAILHRQYNVLIYLIDCGADLEIPNNSQFTPLALANYIKDQKSIELLTLLTKTDASDSLRSPLHRSILANDYVAFKLCLRKKQWLNHKDSMGNTPIHLAMKERNLEFVSQLLNEKITLYFNNDRKTPVDLAYELKEDHPKIWQALQIHCSAKHQLVSAIKSKNKNLIEDLYNTYDAKALNLNAMGRDTPIQLSIDKFPDELLAYFFYKKITPSTQSIYHHAIQRNASSELTYLLKMKKQHKIDESIFTLNQLGHSAIYMAVMHGSNDMVSAFLNSGLDFSDIQYSMRCEPETLFNLDSSWQQRPLVAQLMSPYYAELAIPSPYTQVPVGRGLDAFYRDSGLADIVNIYSDQVVPNLTHVYKDWVTLNKKVSKELKPLSPSDVEPWLNKIKKIRKTPLKSTHCHQLVAKVIHDFLNGLMHNINTITESPNPMPNLMVENNQQQHLALTKGLVLPVKNYLNGNYKMALTMSERVFKKLSCGAMTRSSKQWLTNARAVIGDASFSDHDLIGLLCLQHLYKKIIEASKK